MSARADPAMAKADGRAGDRLEGLSLFYPMYNEEGNIEEAVRRALVFLPEIADAFEVIVVDDGSRDSTGRIADRLAGSDARVRAVHHGTNQGYGAALRSGIEAARFEWIFFTDGDNQFDLSEIRSLLPLRHDHEIVAGYRMDRRDPRHRRVNGVIFNAAVALLFGLKCRDVDCAFKLCHAPLVRGMKLRSAGAMISVEILARARRSRARIAQVGVRHYPRTSGAPSGARLSVILRAGLELVRLWLEMSGDRRVR